MSLLFRYYGKKLKKYFAHNTTTPCLISALLSFCLYFNTLGAEFVYDDSRAIINNHDLLPSTPWKNLLKDDFWGTSLSHSGSHKSYRPLTVASFRLNYLVGGLNPFGYHLVNVILHSAVSALVAFLAQKLSGSNTFLTYTAGTIFAVHPIHTEAVAGAVGRADVLTTLLSLLAFLNYMKFRENGAFRYLFGTVMLTFAAALAKEQGLTVLGLCFVYDFHLLLKSRFGDIRTIWSQQHFAKSWLILLISAIGFMTFRIWIMGSSLPYFSPSDNPAAHADSVLSRFLTFLYLPVINFKLLLCPSILNFDWSMDSVNLIETLFDYRNVMTFVTYSLLAYFVVKLLNENNFEMNVQLPTAPDGDKKFRTLTYDINGNPCHSINDDYEKTKHCDETFCSNVHCVETFKNLEENLRVNTTFNKINCNQIIHIGSFGLLWMIGTFIPASNLFFYVGFVVAERVLYLPSVGYCILLAYCIRTVRAKYETRFGFAAKLCLLLTLTIFSLKTIRRNRDWANEEALYKSGVEINPAKAYSNLGNVMAKAKRYAEAEFAYKAAINRRPNMADTHYNLGILLQETGKLEEAVRAYENAIHCREKLAVAHLNLGIVLAQLGRKADSEQRYRICSELNGEQLKDPKTHENAKLSCLYNLARSKADQGLHEEAIKIYHRAIENLNPHYQPHSLYNMLGESYVKLNDFKNGEKWYLEALRFKPDHWPAHLTYGHLLLKKKENELALKYFKRAVELSPKDVTVYQHLGQYYFVLEMYKEAEKVYLKTLSMDDRNFDTIFSLANVYRHLGQNNEAEKYYLLAVDIKPNLSNAHMNLGAMLHLNKKYDEAERSYLKSLELNPDDSMTQENLRKLRNLKRK